MKNACIWEMSFSSLSFLLTFCGFGRRYSFYKYFSKVNIFCNTFSRLFHLRQLSPLISTISDANWLSEKYCSLYSQRKVIDVQAASKSENGSATCNLWPIHNSEREQSSEARKFYTYLFYNWIFIFCWWSSWQLKR